MLQSCTHGNNNTNHALPHTKHSARELGLESRLRLVPFEPAPRWGPRALAAALAAPPRVRARGKRAADVMEALAGAAYFSDASAAELARRVICGPPSWEGRDGGDGDGGAGGARRAPGADAARLHAGAAGGRPAPPLPLSASGLLRCARMCVHLRLLPPDALDVLSRRPRWHDGPADAGGATAADPSAPPAAAAGAATEATTAAAAERLALAARACLGGAYRFADPALLARALTHVSVLGAPSYQRLEFVGDALLDLLVSAHLMLRPGPARPPPGVLTKARSVGVRNSRLAAAAAAHGLHLLLRARGARLREAVAAYADAVLRAATADADGGRGDGDGGGGKGEAPDGADGKEAGGAAGSAKRPASPEQTPPPPLPAAAGKPPGAAKRARWQPLSLGLLHAGAEEQRRADEAAAARGSAEAAGASRAPPRASPRWGAADEAVWRAVWQAPRARADDADAATTAATAASSATGAAPGKGEPPLPPPPKVLADVVEAVLAAVYFDSGGDLAAVWRALAALIDLEMLQRDAEALAATAALRGARLGAVEV